MWKYTKCINVQNIQDIQDIKSLYIQRQETTFFSQNATIKHLSQQHTCFFANVVTLKSNVQSNQIVKKDILYQDKLMVCQQSNFLLEDFKWNESHIGSYYRDYGYRSWKLT